MAKFTVYHEKLHDISLWIIDNNVSKPWRCYGNFRTETIECGECQDYIPVFDLQIDDPNLAIMFKIVWAECIVPEGLFPCKSK